MLLRNKGFYMAELIISLSGWMIITTVFVPIYVQLHTQLVQLEERSEAIYLLYEYIQTVIIEDHDRTDHSFTKDDKQFSIVWEGEEKKEAVIRYEDVLGNTVEIHENTP